ncbi:helix-turn-helix domain-containing protein [Lactococcus nasutitermitis]|uniref:Helix-turn-helix domain-containing protein n=1 Tax=Lactococcus nasutitermitis TaxID=1652957 RepID=A0ABV9JGV5_9LACT|nr:helix-turn-helix transcriptional regulator [Lactococcus nasutitermitis]
MVANQLKKILDDRKMSFSDLKKLLEEKEIKVNNSQLSLYANGKRNPKNKKMWLYIAEALNVDLQEIVTDIHVYLHIMDEISENGAEKNTQTENDKVDNFLFQELLSLIDKQSASELEKVNRYCGLSATFEQLGEEIEKEGVVVEFVSGDSVAKKTNPAIAEQVRVNAALIKLDEWFESKRQMQKENAAQSDKDWSEFT